MYQAQCLGMNNSGKIKHILFFYNAAFHNFCISGNRSKRGFQLMGNIRRKFAPQFIPQFFLCFINNYNYGTGNIRTNDDRTCNNLINSLVQMYRTFGTFSL